MYDAIIIGTGPGGYHCAVELNKMGAKVLVVEKGELGGTCVNWGCIPTKALHACADMYSKMKNSKSFGIETSDVTLNFTDVMKRKDRIVKISRLGVKQLLKEVEVVQGEAKIVAKNKVVVDGTEYESKNIVIATGSKPKMLPIEDERIITSKELLGIEELPKSLAIIGGGVIGCEFAYIFNAFGVEVEMYEAADRILPLLDKEISEELHKSFEKKGIKIFTGVKADVSSIECEKILMSVGISPVYDQKEMDALGVKHEIFIDVDEKMQTSVEGIYAIGDVTGKMALAHVAYAQAHVVASNIMGNNKNMNYCVVPSCVFTMPLIASVGKNECDVEDCVVSKANFLANGKARTIGEKEGFIKLIAKDGVLVGAHIIGAHADDLIHESTVLIKNKISIKEIKETIHAHPTLSECFLEAIKGFE